MTHIRLKHTYGSGHLHGLSAPDLHLEIALEPDALHRETQRRLSLSTSVSTGDHTQPLILERGYTATGQLDHLALRSPHRASEQHYQYDALGRMTFRTQQGDSPTIAYTYDKAGRLIASQHGHDAHRYPVDAAGNRSAAPNATNQLAQLNGTRYRYDSAGNLIHREHPDGERLTLGYDGANRLVQLTHISKLGYTRHAHYRYDGLGRRINKTVSHTDGTTATTHYGWDGDRIVREETNNQRTTVVYEPGSFVPMLRIDETHVLGDSQESQEKQVSAYITDALGTPLQLLRPNGQPRWLAEPDDWAAVTNQRAVRGVTQPIRFQGQWHDEESGLYYNRHRYYDPEQGRYISQDPIGLNGGTNLYGYVTNPTGMVDPLGLFGAGFNSVSGAYGPQALEKHGANIPLPSPEPMGQVLTGGDYRPGIGALFPSSMSAFAKDSQMRDALVFQGASRNDITLPAAAGALGMPMAGAAAPGAAKVAAGASRAVAASANQLSLKAVCSVATVSPGAATAIASPAVQQRAIDFVESLVVPGAPQNPVQYFGGKLGEETGLHSK